MHLNDHWQRLEAGETEDALNLFGSIDNNETSFWSHERSKADEIKAQFSSWSDSIGSNVSHSYGCYHSNHASNVLPVCAYHCTALHWYTRDKTRHEPWTKIYQPPLILWWNMRPMGSISKDVHRTSSERWALQQPDIFDERIQRRISRFSSHAIRFELSRGNGTIEHRDRWERTSLVGWRIGSTISWTGLSW